MRITTQMINEGAKKSGLPIHGTSLLNYIKKDADDSLFGNMSETIYGMNTNTSVDSVKRSSYEKLEKIAVKLMDTAAGFTKEGETTMFSKAKETGDKQEIYNSAKSMADYYNDTIKLLKSSDSALDMYYKEMFEDVVTENKDALESIGIIVSNKGNLSIDETKMKEADVDTLESILGTSGMFSAKIGFLASRVAANAESNVSSFSSQYGASGDIQSLLNNKFDWWG